MTTKITFNQSLKLHCALRLFKTENEYLSFLSATRKTSADIARLPTRSTPFLGNLFSQIDPESLSAEPSETLVIIQPVKNAPPLLPNPLYPFMNDIFAAPDRIAQILVGTSRILGVDPLFFFFSSTLHFPASRELLFFTGSQKRLTVPSSCDSEIVLAAFLDSHKTVFEQARQLLEPCANYYRIVGNSNLLQNFDYVQESTASGAGPRVWSQINPVAHLLDFGTFLAYFIYFVYFYEPGVEMSRNFYALAAGTSLREKIVATLALRNSNANILASHLAKLLSATDKDDVSLCRELRRVNWQDLDSELFSAWNHPLVPTRQIVSRRSDMRAPPLEPVRAVSIVNKTLVNVASLTDKDASRLPLNLESDFIFLTLFANRVGHTVILCTNRAWKLVRVDASRLSSRRVQIFVEPVAINHPSARNNERAVLFRNDLNINTYTLVVNAAESRSVSASQSRIIELRGEAFKVPRPNLPINVITLNEISSVESLRLDSDSFWRNSFLFTERLIEEQSEWYMGGSAGLLSRRECAIFVDGKDVRLTNANTVLSNGLLFRSRDNYFVLPYVENTYTYGTSLSVPPRNERQRRERQRTNFGYRLAEERLEKAPVRQNVSQLSVAGAGSSSLLFAISNWQIGGQRVSRFSDLVSQNCSSFYYIGWGVENFDLQFAADSNPTVLNSSRVFGGFSVIFFRLELTPFNIQYMLDAPLYLESNASIFETSRNLTRKKTMFIEGYLLHFGSAEIFLTFRNNPLNVFLHVRFFSNINVLTQNGNSYML
jgi:hypothetical protein